MTPERFATYQKVLARRQPDLTLLTDQVNKGQNIAALLRTCDSVGMHQAHVVTPKEGYRDYPGTARGSYQWIDVIQHPHIEAGIERLKQQGMQLIAAHFSSSAVDFRTYDYTQPTAIIVGAEMHGISPAAAVAADYHVTVPMVGMSHSYNVSVAGAIIMLEAQRQRELAGCYASPRLDPDTYKDTLFRWCHPTISDYCQTHGVAFPPINIQGDIIDLPNWYTKTRALIDEKKASVCETDVRDGHQYE